jgi:phosphoserine aminotransferase
MFRLIASPATRSAATAFVNASTRPTLAGINSLAVARYLSAAAPGPKPANPEFSSGPCKKHPGFSLTNLPTSSLGRSHRSKLGKERLAFAISETKRLLKIPDDYLVGIVPASDTGAYEMAMWNMLGAKDIDICHWESFGKGWFADAVSHLKLRDSVDVREHTAGYGEIPDLSQTSADRDICFTFNGTTSGVRVPHGCDWISDDRTGLTLCDATSAVFAMDMPWEKLDVTTYSWQKVLGGEGAHGMLILSPRAVERLESFVPENRPLPKIFRMTKKGKVDGSIFKGATINTPSMMAVEDYIDALQWCDSVGGVDGLIKISNNNLAAIEKFVADNDWIDFLAKDPATRSNTSVCCTLDLSPEQIKAFVALLEKENVALDIGGYRDAPPSIRIWCGATVETADVEALMPWLKWAYEEVKK